MQPPFVKQCNQFPSSMDPSPRTLNMIWTVEAIVDEHGHVRLLEEVELPETR